MIEYQNEQEKKNKKKIIFEFVEMEAFNDYRGKIDIYERNANLRKKYKK